MEFGQTDAQLLAARAVAGLAVGLYAYSAFLLLARGYYLLSDGRTPGVVSLVSASVGVVVMVVSAVLVDGTARIVLLGLGHSIAYHGGRRRPGAEADPPHRGHHACARRSTWGARVFVSALAGIGEWAASEAVLGDDPGRLASLTAVMVIAAIGAGVVVAGCRLVGVPAALDNDGQPTCLRRRTPSRSRWALPREVLCVGTLRRVGG